MVPEGDVTVAYWIPAYDPDDKWIVGDGGFGRETAYALGAVRLYPQLESSVAGS